MKLLTVAPGQGTGWVRQGLRVLARRPAAFIGLCFGFVFCATQALRFPPLLVLLAALLPLLSLGFMNASRHVAEGGRDTLRAFLAPLHPRHPRARMLLKMTVAYAVASVVAGLLSSWAYGDSFAALVDAETAEKPDPAVIATRLAEPRLGLGMLVQLLLAALLSVPFWHAPPLIFWGGQSLAQALFSSTVACWRNRAAFLVYGFGFGSLVLACVLVGGALMLLLGDGPITMMLALLLSMVLVATFYASLWFTFRACFDLSNDEPPPP